MALVKCPDCGKPISDKAVSCNACGCPLGGGGSVGNVAFEKFEKRIEEYKNAGYKLVKREGDTVTMFKNNFLKYFLYVIVSLIISVAFLTFLLIISGYYFAMAVGIFMAFFSLWSVSNSFKVKITINKIGKIEESGNVLKNKSKKK